MGRALKGTAFPSLGELLALCIHQEAQRAWEELGDPIASRLGHIPWGGELKNLPFLRDRALLLQCDVQSSFGEV